MDFLTEFITNVKDNMSKKLGIIIVAVVAVLGGFWFAYHGGSSSARASYDENGAKAHQTQTATLYNERISLYPKKRLSNEELQKLRETSMREYDDNN